MLCTGYKHIELCLHSLHKTKLTSCIFSVFCLIYEFHVCRNSILENPQRLQLVQLISIVIVCSIAGYALRTSGVCCRESWTSTVHDYNKPTTFTSIKTHFGTYIRNNTHVCDVTGFYGNNYDHHSCSYNIHQQ